VQDNVPESIFSKIKAETDPSAFDFGGKRYNSDLAGNLKKEYQYRPSAALKSELSEYLRRLANYYWAQWGTLPPEFEIKRRNELDVNGDPLLDLWVNFQSKHEYNPMHHHNGELSFVIWVSIPYDIKDEMAVFPETYSKTTATFNFCYPNHFTYGGLSIHTLEADRNWEGKIILFNSSLQHCVYPFYTSDQYRISVSGNLGTKQASA
jgi:hypothetical protein